MGNLSIHSFTIKNITDNPSIFEKYKDPSGYIKNCGAQWVKLLTSNPYAHENDLALILAIDDQTVVGRLGLYSALVLCNRKDEKTFWLDGFFLNNEYKNSGVGGLMILKAISFSKSLLAAGGPRKDAQALYARTGLRELAQLKRFLYFYSVRVILRKYIGVEWLCSFLSSILNTLFPLYYKMRIHGKKFVLDYKPVECFDKRIDCLIKNIHPLNCFPKYAAVLNWVLQNKKNISAFQIFNKDELIGYCLLRQIHQKEGDSPEYLPEMEVGSLLDYFVTDTSESTLQDLILFCLDFFKKKNIDVCAVQVHDTPMASICRDYGFIHKGGDRVFFRPSPEMKFDRNDRWFLTHGTSDVLIAESV